MINDNDRRVRKLGWRRIIKARSQDLSIGKVRNFAMPELHYNSLRYYEMINWQVIEQTEPPVTRVIPERQIKDLLRMEASLMDQYHYFLATHKQSSDS